MCGQRLRFGVLFALVVCVGLAGARTQEEGDKAIGQEESIRAVDHVGASRFAVSIGINDYADGRIPDLAFCEGDAKAFHALITDPEVGGVAAENATLLLGPEATTRNVKTALAALRHIPADSTVFVYYSGHGAKEMGDAFWVTQDSEMNNLLGTALRDGDLQSMLARMAAQRVVLLMDCCYAAALVKENKSIITDFGETLKRFTGKGRAFLSAAGSGEEAIESADIKRSVFTHFVLGGLAGDADANRDGVVVLTELTEFVDSHVADEARRRGGVQRPVVDLKELQEPSKFLLTVDAEQLRRNILDTRQARELREQRLARLRELYLEQELNLAQYQLGQRLFNAVESTLEREDRLRLAEFVALLEGRLAADRLQRALDAIAPPRPAGPVTRVVPGDHASIQAAIDACSPGDTVLVEPGTYTEHVVFKEGITLRGKDAERCILKIVPGQKRILLAQGCTSGSIGYLTFDGSGGTLVDEWKPDGIGLVDAAVEVVNCFSRHNVGIGISVEGTGRRVSPIIKGNVCEENGDVGIMVFGPGADPTVTFNQCRNQQHFGLYFGLGCSGLAEHNLTEMNGFSGIAVVDPKTSVRLVSNETYRNVKNGIHVARGATCTALANVCEENVDMGIQVEDAQSSATLQKNRCNRNQEHGIFISTGARGRIDENTCEGNLKSGIAVVAEGTTPDVRDNRCTGNSNFGLYYAYGSGGTARGNVCRENLNSGIAVYNFGTRPRLEDNRCEENFMDGIYFSKGAGGEAVSNVCDRNQWSGISIDEEGTGPLIRLNSCSYNGRFGIGWTPEALPIVEPNNTLIGNVLGN